MSDEIGEKLVKALKMPEESDSQESFARAMELSKAYASSGSATHFSAVARLFYDLFEMFETGKDPRQ
jgi:formiminotetrahydrofolate cyclodeaminase